MKKIQTTLQIVLLGCCLFPALANAGSGYARQDGNWNSADTWFFDGDGRKPRCGDTVSIDAGTEVTITAQENYSNCQAPLTLIIGGALQFINGFKLDLPEGSVVNILPGGVVRKITPGGGNSTLISICGGVAWAARDGDLFGPAVLVCLSPLPVALVDWSVQPEAASVDVNWTTATELNNDHFEIERSVDGREFSRVAWVAGAGTSAMSHDYEWSDAQPLAGLSYYRLCQVDIDGVRTTYNISAVSWKGRQRIRIVPNPSPADRVGLYFEGDKQWCNIHLTDASGYIVFQKAVQLEPGANSVYPGYLQDGLYILSVETGGTLRQEKVLIQSATQDGR